MNRHKPKTKNEVRVIPRAMKPLANGEAAPAGTAVLAVNVRQREQSLQVTGSPATVGALAVGDRLLLLADDHRVTCAGSTVKVDNAAVATVNGTVVGAHAIGDIIVIVTDQSLTYLRQNGGTWTVLDPAAAIPGIELTAQTATVTAGIPAYTFIEPYRQWQAPLSEGDTTALAALLRSSWNALSADIAAVGRHRAPLHGGVLNNDSRMNSFYGLIQ